MAERGYQIYGYRWAVLAAFMLAVIANQLLWISFAPITGMAAEFYSVSDLQIGLLSLIFMVVYILVSFPASWVIDNKGLRTAVGVGAAMTGFFGLLRGFTASSYDMVLVSQIGIAIGQPFILNAITKVAARWFPANERATASGMGSLAIYLGVLIGLLLTPHLTLRVGLGRMLVFYGIAAAVMSAAFLVMGRERPPSPPGPPELEARALMLTGLKQILRQRSFWLLLSIFFVGLGAFNAVTTWIEDILRPRGFSITQAGSAGGLMIFGGVIGALILPLLSDRAMRRKPFIITALIGATIGLAGLTFFESYPFLLLAAFTLGFFLLSAGPIGFQYGAEITYPAPEGTSNGLLLMIGQVSGIAFILAMDSLKDPLTGSMTAPLLGILGLLLVSLLASVRLRESPVILTAEEGAG